MKPSIILRAVNSAVMLYLAITSLIAVGLFLMPMTISTARFLERIAPWLSVVMMGWIATLACFLSRLIVSRKYRERLLSPVLGASEELSGRGKASEAAFLLVAAGFIAAAVAGLVGVDIFSSGRFDKTAAIPLEGEWHGSRRLADIKALSWPAFRIPRVNVSAPVMHIVDDGAKRYELIQSYFLPPELSLYMVACLGIQILAFHFFRIRIKRDAR